MKELISLFIRKQLQKAGIFYQRFPLANHPYDYLGNRSDKIKKYELKRICKRLKVTNNHNVYNQLLKQFVPDWDVNLKNPQFIGITKGNNNLNAHRKVTIGHTVYFEKVYFNYSQDLFNLEWFYDNIYEQLLKGKLKVPQIEKVYRGELLTITYYEFLDLTPLPESEREEILIKYTKDLHQISLENNAYLSGLDIPESVKDFRYYNRRYRSRRSLLKGEILENKLGIKDINRIEKQIMSSKPVVIHGDITWNNTTPDAILIDWDNFGIYCMGFDTARTYYRFLRADMVDGNYIDWLTVNYKSTVIDEDWQDFKRNALYFLYTFAHTRFFSQGKYKSMEKKIAVEMQQYLR